MLLKILLYLPMAAVGLYYGVCSSIPSGSDTIPLASSFIGIILVLLPMLVAACLNITMFIVSMVCKGSKIQTIVSILGMLSSAAEFLYLLIISSFMIYIPTGICLFIAFVSGGLLLFTGRRNDNQKENP